MQPAPVYLALGSNLGDRRANLEAAIASLPPVVMVTGRSRIYETAPAYVLDQPAFLNMVVGGVTHVAPLALLRSLKQIEQALGRQPAARFGPRLIDLDMLAYADLVLESPELTLPHPRIAERAFVLVPLADIAPNLVLPGYIEPISALAARAPGTWRALENP